MTTKLPNGLKICQIATKYTGTFPFQGPPKYTQIGIFGMKIYHLATLVGITIFTFLRKNVHCGGGEREKEL
jgi:hypothetical protein